jgi:hypothetical protein
MLCLVRGYHLFPLLDIVNVPVLWLLVDNPNWTISPRFDVLRAVAEYYYLLGCADRPSPTFRRDLLYPSSG